MKNIFLFVIAAALCACGQRVVVNYDLPLNNAVAKATEVGKPLVVLLSRPDCPPCSALIRNLESNANIPSAIYNVVDVQLPENNWYTQWLCLGTFPTSCLFDADGHLTAVINGASNSSMDCLAQSVDGQTKCADYYYTTHFPVIGNKIDMLNEMLDCQRAMERGEDAAAALDEVLKKCDYPWLVWLKIQNEIKQGRSENAAILAERMSQFSEPIFLTCYADILQQSKYIANPAYSPDDEAKLVIPEEIKLADCIVSEPREFNVEISNEGKMPLSISDIQMSCTCMELLSDKQLTLAPGEKSTVRVAFTADSAGDFFREVLFFSNSSEKLMRVAIRASAKNNAA